MRLIEKSMANGMTGFWEIHMECLLITTCLLKFLELAQSEILSINAEKDTEKSTRARTVDVIDEYLIRNINFIAIYENSFSAYSEIDDILCNIHVKISVALVFLPNTGSDEMYSVVSRSDNTESGVGYIIFTSYDKSTCLPAYNWTTLSFWNPQARFIVFVSEILTDVTYETVGMLEDCWESLNILNIAVVYIRLTASVTCPTSLSTHVAVYNPFNQNISTTEIGTKGLIDNFEVFPQKLGDTYGCKFNITTSPSSEQVDIEYKEDGSVHYAGPSSLATFAAVKEMNDTVKMLPPTHSIQKAVFINNDIEALDITANHRNVCRAMSRISAMHFTALPRLREGERDMCSLVGGCTETEVFTLWWSMSNEVWRRLSEEIGKKKGRMGGSHIQHCTSSEWRLCIIQTKDRGLSAALRTQCCSDQGEMRSADPFTAQLETCP
ncbi:hypothetical protein PR048_005813 [Dryococelus australis]|uniref:Uncharacterized protein n=1 Tax=Dryococelus australis TaxID=614101 RepID=A0ABQ9I987_9NEOP|nr:hypothetical protein PR048_005813 [Dryococelus australis]